MSLIVLGTGGGVAVNGGNCPKGTVDWLSSVLARLLLCLWPLMGAALATSESPELLSCLRASNSSGVMKASNGCNPVASSLSVSLSDITEWFVRGGCVMYSEATHSGRCSRSRSDETAMNDRVSYSADDS